MRWLLAGKVYMSRGKPGEETKGDDLDSRIELRAEAGEYVFIKSNCCRMGVGT
jgi:hypothetical protein